MAQVFVAMSFEDSFDIVNETIHSACEYCNVKEIRMDKATPEMLRKNENDIWDSIVSEIKRSLILVGDFTLELDKKINQNVLTEVSMGMGMGKKIIIISQKPIELPFDWKHFRIIVYDNTTEGLEILKENLISEIKAITKDLDRREITEPQRLKTGRAKTIAVMNYKGGVGKTTLTLNLGTAFAKAGYKTLIIDLDPQLSLTFSCITEEVYKDWISMRGSIADIYRSYLRESDYNDDRKRKIKSLDELNISSRIIENAIRGAINNYSRFQYEKPEIEGVDLLPSDIKLNFYETKVLTDFDSTIDPNLQWFWQVTILRDLLQSEVNGQLVLNNYDVILFDCPPNLYLSTQNAIMSSSYWIAPSQADFLSISGFRNLRERVKELRTSYNKILNLDETQLPIIEDYKNLGLILTRLRSVGGRSGGGFLKNQQDKIDQIKTKEYREKLFSIENKAYIPEIAKISDLSEPRTTIFGSSCHIDKRDEIATHFEIIRDVIIKRIGDFQPKGLLKKD